MVEPELVGNVLYHVMDRLAHPDEVLRIVVDSRERQPWLFRAFPSVMTVRATLDAGDYKAEGSAFVVERKTGADFLSSISWGRERFERELARMQAAGGGAVVVEAALHEVLYGAANRGGLRVHSNAILGSVASFLVRFGVPVLFASSRDDAEALACHLLRHVERQRLQDGGKAEGGGGR